MPVKATRHGTAGFTHTRPNRGMALPRIAPGSYPDHKLVSMLYYRGCAALRPAVPLRRALLGVGASG
jgi:hypothetical protein